MKDSNPSDYFRFILKRYRHEKGLTQEQLSERIGISNSFLGMIETGRKRPNIDMLFRIATALEVRPSTLITAQEEEISK
ncbi:MAG: helix-turn-helix domain-containing protein [Acutalibacteraceae bacterium]